MGKGGRGASLPLFKKGLEAAHITFSMWERGKCSLYIVATCPATKQESVHYREQEENGGQRTKNSPHYKLKTSGIIYLDLRYRGLVNQYL